MRILWISYLGSWTKPLAEQIAKQHQIWVVVPSLEKKEIVENGVHYCYIDYSSKEASCPMSEVSFKKIFSVIQKINPDVIHVHGTEKNLAQVQRYLPKIPVVVSIQGLVNGCLPYTRAYIDEKKVLKYKTLKNFFGFGGLMLMDRTLRKTAATENQILNDNNYFFGRTDFDKAHILLRNPNAKYFVGEELLRPEFYSNSGSWCLEKCDRYSIFMPSGFNPIKGMHLAVECVGILKKFFPNVKLYVPGVFASEREKKRLLSIITGEEYIRYVYDMVIKKGLCENVVFMPRLSAAQMAEHMKKTHVFFAPSSIDNSPNAVGEATMIGCPMVTTPVGGIPSFIKDGVHALLSPAGDPYMLAYYIKKIFEDDELAKVLSKNAHGLASIRHGILKATEQYIHGYEECIKMHRRKNENID